MPWQCKGCSTSVLADTTTTCPRCGAKKVAWSMLAQKTRAFVVQSKRFDVLRGVGGRALPAGDPALAEVATVPTEVAWAVPRATARRWREAGLLPPARHVLFVRLHPRKHPDLTVQVGVQLVAGEVKDEALAPPDGTDPAADAIDVPALVLFGPGEPVAFDGLATLDVSDAAAPGGHAPSIEVQALRRPAKQVRVSTGIEVRLLEAPRREGAPPRPVRHAHVYLTAPGEGPPLLDDALFTDEAGWLCVPKDDPHGGQSAAPTERARRLDGEQLRLHWSYAPREAEALAALPAKAWTTVTVAGELTLRPSRLRGCLHVKLLRLEVKDDKTPPAWVALASTAYTLTGEDGATLTGTTTAEGALRHDGVPLQTWRLEAGGLVDLLEAGGGDEPADVLLRPAVVAARGAERTKKGGDELRVFLTRHGDRVTSDDAISADKGQARARALCARLEAEGIDEVCVTSFRRTQQTAAPLAKKLGLTPVVLEYDGDDVDAYVKRAVARVRAKKTGAMLIVGHSETTPVVVKELTGQDVTIGGAEFHKLFEVTLRGGKGTVVTGTYGEGSAASGGDDDPPVRDDSIGRAAAFLDPELAAAGEA